MEMVVLTKVTLEKVLARGMLKWIIVDCGEVRWSVGGKSKAPGHPWWRNRNANNQLGCQFFAK